MPQNYKSNEELNRESRFRQNQIELEKQKYDSTLIKTGVIAAGAVTLDLLTQNAYAQAWGSQTDGFEDSIWNANNMFTLQEGYIDSSNEFSGYLHLQKDDTEIRDRVVTEEYPGEQTLTAKFSETTPDNFTGYGITIGNLTNTDYANLIVANWDNTLYYLFEDDTGALNLWEPISGNGPYFLKLEKTSTNTVNAYVSRDGTNYTQLSGSTGVPANTGGFIGSGFGTISTAIHEAQEFNFSGPQVPNKNNEAPLPLGLDLGILTSALLAYGIIRIKRKIF